MRRFTSFDGTEIAYTDESSGDPVVLLHGFTIDAKTNFGPAEHAQAVTQGLVDRFGPESGIVVPDPGPPEDQGIAAAVLATGRRVIAPDMRGHGLSGKPTERSAYVDRAMARDVLGLLDELGVERFDAVGYSMGSVTLTHLLAIAPERVRSAVLCGIGAWIVAGEPFVGPPELMPPSLEQPVLPDAWFQAAARSAESGEPGIGSMYTALGDLTGMSPEVIVAILWEIASYPATPAELARVETPVLVLNGDADLAKPQEPPLANYFRNLEFGSCSGDHMTAIFDRDLHRSILEFLQRT
jgi:pimeloyl-ACP methyl ester carboxylesterase